MGREQSRGAQEGGWFQGPRAQPGQQATPTVLLEEDQNEPPTSSFRSYLMGNH